VSPRRIRVTLVIAAAVLPVFVAAAVLVSAGVVRTPGSNPAAANVTQASPSASTARAATATPKPGSPTARSGAQATPSPHPTPAPFYGQQWLAAHPQPPLPLHARGALLADLDSHQVLWASEPQLSLPPASLTKTMTAALALHHATLDTEITVPQAATTVEPTTMGLSPGERLTVRELLYGVFLLSANDAAEALAQGIIPRERFLAEMNQLARSWGLTGSTFTNPSGLDDAGLRASAQDLAVIVGHLEQEHPEVLQISGAPQVNLPQSPAHKGYQLSSVIGLIARAYPGATGLKTGFTDDAGYCLIGTATRGTRHLIAVVLNSDTDVNDVISLLDYGFATPAPPPG
jgi:serine-type D-Ala-D-Ala carboxypeptidase (penicillin-binding protein 5/6)